MPNLLAQETRLDLSIYNLIFFFSEITCVTGEDSDILNEVAIWES